MHARIFSAQVQPEQLDQLVTVFQEAIVPAARQQEGFLGIRLFVGRATGKAVVVSRWHSEAARLSGEASGYYQEQLVKVVSFLTAPPGRETLEIAVESDA